MKSTGNFMEHIRKSHSEIVNEVELYRKHGNCDKKHEILENKQHSIQELFKRCNAEDVSFEIVY